jgi:hypothetical protein
MLMDDYRKGHADYRPFYVIDKDTGKLVELYLPADAVAAEAKPGYKAGNPALDEVNEQIRRDGLLEKFKRLYQISKGGQNAEE